MLEWFVVVLAISNNQPMRVLPQSYPTQEDCRQDTSAIEDIDVETEYATCRLIEKPLPKK